MNFFEGGEPHCSADYTASRSRSADSDTASPGGLSFLDVGRPGDVRNFVHKKIGGFIGGAIRGEGVVGKIFGGIGGLQGLPGPAGEIFGAVGSFIDPGATVPQGSGCPPGFTPTPDGCVPKGPSPGRRGFRTQQAGFFPDPTPVQRGARRDLGLLEDPAAGVPVMGRFGAGTEPEIFMTDTRRCPRRSVLGVDGVCYNKGDLKNADRWWPRGRRPLLTGGEMRAISTASSAAKKLQRKQKQLESLGLLKRPAPRSRRALPAGHRAELRHSGSGHE